MNSGMKKEKTENSNGFEPNMPDDTKRLGEKDLLSARYCKKCRDVCLGDKCDRCGNDAAVVKGTVKEFKQVLNALANDREEWREMIECMISDGNETGK